jgi:hypothetical protein
MHAPAKVQSIIDLFKKVQYQKNSVKQLNYHMHPCWHITSFRLSKAVHIAGIVPFEIPHIFREYSRLLQNNIYEIRICKTLWFYYFDHENKSCCNFLIQFSINVKYH